MEVNSTEQPQRKARKTYEEINAMWHDATKRAPLTPTVAMRAAAKLWDHFLGGDRYPIDTTSGNRYTWVHDGVLSVNADKGWHGLVHDLSHLFHHKLYQRSRRIDGNNFDAKMAKPHSPAHAKLERKIAEYVVKKGWLDGALTPKIKPPKPEPTPEEAKVAARQVKLSRCLASIERWERKAKRAKTALAKLHRSRRALERSHNKQ